VLAFSHLLRESPGQPLSPGRSLDVERVIDLIATTAERALCR
jgi:hypothetical protein